MFKYYLEMAKHQKEDAFSRGANRTNFPDHDFTRVSRTVSAMMKGNTITKAHSILDFGSGLSAKPAHGFKAEGFNITAYDNEYEKLDKHEKAKIKGDKKVDPREGSSALNRKYDVVYASNVINVQYTFEQLATACREIKESMKPNSIFIMNYPTTPRNLYRDLYDEKDKKKLVHKATLEKKPGFDGKAGAELMKKELSKYFKDIELVKLPGINSSDADPIWKMKKK